MHRKLKIAPTAYCHCQWGQVEQTVSHILQDCPLLDQLRRTTWPEGAAVQQKLWGFRGQLQGTFQFVSSSGLQVWQRSKIRSRVCVVTAVSCISHSLIFSNLSSQTTCVFSSKPTPVKWHPSWDGWWSWETTHSNLMHSSSQSLPEVSATEREWPSGCQ